MPTFNTCRFFFSPLKPTFTYIHWQTMYSIINDRQARATTHGTCSFLNVKLLLPHIPDSVCGCFGIFFFFFFPGSIIFWKIKFNLCPWIHIHLSVRQYVEVRRRLISAHALRPRSWPCLRRVGGTCCRWCMRNRRGGPTRSRATPASAACGLRWGRPMGSSERPRTLCSSSSGPSTATGIAQKRLVFNSDTHSPMKPITPV